MAAALASAGAAAPARVAAGAGRASESSLASASLETARPPPSTVPPAISPPLTNVRRSMPCCRRDACSLSILLSSSALMASVRAPIVGLTLLLALGLAIGLAGSARAASPAPACAPSTLNTSAQLDGAVTVSPLPGSRDATPQTQISFLGVPAGELSGVSVDRLADRRAQRPPGGLLPGRRRQLRCRRTRSPRRDA